MRCPSCRHRPLTWWQNLIHSDRVPIECRVCHALLARRGIWAWQVAGALLLFGLPAGLGFTWGILACGLAVTATTTLHFYTGGLRLLEISRERSKLPPARTTGR